MVALLERIDNPYSLRQLKPAQLPALAKELREFMLASVAKTGGHLASNLGTVELTIALHYIFDTPDDRLIWDVGHQSYPHKILTGRRDKLPAIRTLSGISGFPRRDESEYDTFGTGHSSTALSAIMGMAQAIRLRGEHRHCIAVIGDGALSAGLAYEAMNNILTCANLPLLVILNDNDMSISPSVGGLKHHLAALLKSHGLQRTSPGNQHILAKQTLLSANTVTAANTATLFSILGFEYSGPIDGHDFNAFCRRCSPSIAVRGRNCSMSLPAKARDTLTLKLIRFYTMGRANFHRLKALSLTKAAYILTRRQLTTGYATKRPATRG